MAQLHAGFSERTALHTINRACSSGLAAVTSIAHMITVGAIDVGVGAGMESMTKNYGFTGYSDHAVGGSEDDLLCRTRRIASCLWV